MRRLSRIYQAGDHRSLGQRLVQQLEPLGVDGDIHAADTSHIAARPIHAGNETIGVVS
jgi:hypothetical protein